MPDTISLAWQMAFGNTGGREDDVIAARHIAQAQYFTGFDAHRFAACQLLLANATILFVVAFDVMTRQQTTVHVAI